MIGLWVFIITLCITVPIGIVLSAHILGIDLFAPSAVRRARRLGYEAGRQNRGRDTVPDDIKADVALFHEWSNAYNNGAKDALFYD